MQVIRIHVDLGSFGLGLDHGSVRLDTVVTAELSVEVHMNQVLSKIGSGWGCSLR